MDEGGSGRDTGTDCALGDYLPAFAHPTEPFLVWFAVHEGGIVTRQEYTRGGLWGMARQAAGVLERQGLEPGERFLLCFSGNHPADLAFRLAAVMTGTVPVTVNWQADNAAQLHFKRHCTQARMAVTARSFAQREALGDLPCFYVDDLAHITQPADLSIAAEPAGVNGEYGCYGVSKATVQDPRIIIFTSGTTGRPKGVLLTYDNYRTNGATFDQFLDVDPDTDLALFVVNPLHHTNSTAMTDWAMRRPKTRLYLLERYTTPYWRLLTEAVEAGHERLVAPAVSRHFDFLETLDRDRRLPVERERLIAACGHVDFLIGSAPVGPTTVERIVRWSGRVPTVRFGSTETCLQVIGIPAGMTERQRLDAFRSGWGHRCNGEPQPGYFVGRPHPPHTEVRVVRAIDRTHPGFMVDCAPGEPGYLVTRGGHVMAGYVDDRQATATVMHEDWYLGLQDIGFALTDPGDGELNYYWMSRDAALLIRGGANYACDQINTELAAFLTGEFGVPAEYFDLAVVGLKVNSEHEDACCVTIELLGTDGEALRERLTAEFCVAARRTVSKGARPDFLRFGAIPRNFKGAVQLPELKQQFSHWLNHKEDGPTGNT